MKVLIEIDTVVHAHYKTIARARGGTLASLYRAALAKVLSIGLLATLGPLEPRKSRSDKGTKKPTYGGEA